VGEQFAGIEGGSESTLFVANFHSPFVPQTYQSVQRNAAIFPTQYHALSFTTVPK